MDAPLGEVRRIIPPNREHPGTVFGLEYVWEQTEDQQQCLWVTQKWPLVRFARLARIGNNEIPDSLMALA
jgi:hypothetical protein